MAGISPGKAKSRPAPECCGWRAYVATLLPFPVAVLLLTMVFGYTPRLDQSHGLPAIAFYLRQFPVSLFNGLATAALGAGPPGEEGQWSHPTETRKCERTAGFGTGLSPGYDRDWSTAVGREWDIFAVTTGTPPRTTAYAPTLDIPRDAQARLGMGNTGRFLPDRFWPVL